MIDHNVRLKEENELGTILYLLGEQTINLSEIYRKNKASAHSKQV